MTTVMEAPRVVVVRSPRVWTGAGALDPAILARMFARGFTALTGERDPARAAAAIVRPGDRVGIKVNTIGGRALSTRPEVAAALASWFVGGGIAERDLVVWDRTTRELRDAGYTVNTGRSGLRIFGTDADGTGYESALVSHLDVGSLFSRVLTDHVTVSISLAVLKDHGLAGVTAGMKNYFGAIHNPNKYHDDRCDPFVAQVFDAPPVRSRHRLTVIDALTVQFHRGPSYHARWAAPYGGLVFSLDPVAADWTGWRIVERLREEAGLPTLEAEGRRPGYIETAERMGLGRAAADLVETVEEPLP